MRRGVLCFGGGEFRICVDTRGRHPRYTTVAPLDDAVLVPAGRVAGFPPAPVDEDELVVALARPPLSASAILIRRGASYLRIPTRWPTLNQNFITMFTLMTEPAPRVVYSELLEFDLPEGAGMDEVKRTLTSYYGNRLEWIDLAERLGVGNTIEAEHYTIKTERRGILVVFEAKGPRVRP